MRYVNANEIPPIPQNVQEEPSKEGNKFGRSNGKGENRDFQGRQ